MKYKLFGFLKSVSAALFGFITSVSTKVFSVRFTPSGSFTVGLVLAGFVVVAIFGSLFMGRQSAIESETAAILTRMSVETENEALSQRMGAIEEALRETHSRLARANDVIEMWEQTASGVVVEMQYNLLIAHSATQARAGDIAAQRLLRQQLFSEESKSYRLEQDVALWTERYLDLEDHNETLIALIERLGIETPETPETIDSGIGNP